MAWESRGAPGVHGLLASVAVVAEFGRIAVEFLRRGSNPKIYEGAASKTGRVAAGGKCGPFFGTLERKGFLQLLGSYCHCGRIKAERLFWAQILPVP